MIDYIGIRKRIKFIRTTKLKITQVELAENKKCRINRTYLDYQKYITSHPNANIVK